MSDPFFRSSVASEAVGASFDTGLRAHMQRVFNYMAGGLALTGATSYLVANTALFNLIFHTPLAWIVMLSPLAFIMYLRFRLERMSVTAVQGVFWAFCISMGASMASIFYIYAGADIARAFFITSATFAAMSLWGYSTKQDLSGFGSFLMMGVLGLFIASIINLFLASSGMQWVVSVIGVAVFTGLTAYDVQNIKRAYAESWGNEVNNKVAVMCALQLYLNFINAFQFLLSLMGGRRD